MSDKTKSVTGIDFVSDQKMSADFFCGLTVKNTSKITGKTTC